jgi:phenylacetate-CoA ligase
MRGDWKATRAGLNGLVKSWAGVPYRNRVRGAWNLSAEEFWAYQGSAFQSMYQFARTRVPYYQQHLDSYPPLAGRGDHILDWLPNLPILDKQTVRSHNEELWAKPLLPMTTFHATSGTSGTPLRLAATVWEKGMVRAILEDWYARICGARKPRMLSLSGFMTPSAESKELVWTDRLTGVLSLSIYSMNQANRDAILELYYQLRPQVIYGYASAVHQLALVFAGERSPFRDETVAVVTSEVLQPHWRTEIEATLCRKVFNFYGSQEGSHLALECEAGNMHIHPMGGIIEIVDDEGRQVRAGERGRVVVTGLVRRSMPMIRYDLGDVVESTGYATDCACGLAWPTIGTIQGRSEDLVKTRDGREIGYLCFHATKNLRGIKEAQIVQKGYEQFVCKLVTSEAEAVSTAYLEEQIRSQITSRMLLDVNVQFEYLDAIPRGANGKFKAVVVDFG